jgi:hypothetical protein
MESVDPPGGKGTTIVTGLSGQARALRLVKAVVIRAMRAFFIDVSYSSVLSSVS